MSDVDYPALIKEFMETVGKIYPKNLIHHGRFLDRTEDLKWNETGKMWRTRDLAAVDKVILHQELGNADEDGVNNYHIRYDSRGTAYGRNWPRIAYHFVIRTDGTVVQCNKLEHVTYHAGKMNTSSIGIMLVGDFSGPGYTGHNSPSLFQKAAFFAVVRGLLLLESLESFSSCQEVYGHCHFGKPACPGSVAETWIEEVRGWTKIE